MINFISMNWEAPESASVSFSARSNNVSDDCYGYCVLCADDSPSWEMKQRMPFCCTLPADFVTEKQDFSDLLPCPITGRPTLTAVESYLILIPAPLDSVFNELPCSACCFAEKQEPQQI